MHTHIKSLKTLRKDAVEEEQAKSVNEERKSTSFNTTTTTTTVETSALSFLVH